MSRTSYTSFCRYSGYTFSSCGQTLYGILDLVASDLDHCLVLAYSLSASYLVSSKYIYSSNCLVFLSSFLPLKHYLQMLLSSRLFTATPLHANFFLSKRDLDHLSISTYTSHS